MRKPTVAPERIVALAKSGKFTTQKCVAEHVGLSRERVRQVLKKEGVRFGKNQRGAPISWPCPECNKAITRPYIYRNAWRHMPAHCRGCATNYCLRGHRKQRDGLTCKVCLQRIIRYRICIDCGKNIPVTYNNDRQARLFGWKLERCQSCQGKRSIKKARQR